MNTLASLSFNGGLPARGDVATNFWAWSLVNQQAVQLSTTQVVTIPETANDVHVSDGGQWAWIGQNSGIIYLGQNPVLDTNGNPVKGYGTHSFLFVGETLKTFSDVTTYQATAGGWAYIGEDGNIVTQGSYYSNPPLANAVKFHDIWIGQGPEDGQGLCCYVPGESGIRQILSGSANDIRVARTGDTFRIITVNYSGHLTLILEVDLSELLTMPTLGSVSSSPTTSTQIQAHPRKLLLAPYYSFSVRYGDATLDDWKTYANAAVIIGDDPSNIPADLDRVYRYGVPLIVDSTYGAQAQPYIGSVIAWLASGADFPSLQTAVEEAINLPECPVIAYLDAPEQWPSSRPAWLTDRIWPAVQAYRKAGESVADFTTRLTNLLTLVSKYGSYMVLTARWDDVNGTQPVSFTTDCMPVYAQLIQQFPICGLMHFSDKRGHGISADASLKQWAQTFSLANVTRPDRYDYWTLGDPASSLKNKLGQSTELISLTTSDKQYLLSKL